MCKRSDVFCPLKSSNSPTIVQRPFEVQWTLIKGCISRKERLLNRNDINLHMDLPYQGSVL